MKGPKRPLNLLATWVRPQPPKMKVFLAVLSAMAVLPSSTGWWRMMISSLLLPKPFMLLEFVFSFMSSQRRGLALVLLRHSYLSRAFTQITGINTYIFRCQTLLQLCYGTCIHILLDLATFHNSMGHLHDRLKLTSSYMDDEDSFPLYYLVIPCGLLTLFIHPMTHHYIINCILWAICVFLEVIQIVEPFTALYVFASGVARFLSCAQWILQL